MEGTNNNPLPPLPKQVGGGKAMELSIATWNSTGSGINKCQWFNEYLANSDIKLANIQETFRTGKASNQHFKNQYKDYRNSTISAKRKDTISTGRASGGLVQLWRKDLQMIVENISTVNYRVQAQNIKIGTYNIIWINTYHPTDKPGSSDISELEELLSEVSDILDNHPNSEVIWAGDMNYNTKKSTVATKRYKEWLSDKGLSSTSEQLSIDYTYTHTDHTTTSLLDHIVVSPNMINLITEGGVFHSPLCPSGHDPVWLRLAIPVKESMPQQRNTKPRKPAWHKADSEAINNYTNTLHNNLPSSKLDKCLDTQCKDPKHLDSIDNHMMDILTKIVETSYETIPLSQKRSCKNNKIKKGWSTRIAPLRKEAIKWHRTWSNEGKPSVGWLKDTMVKHRKAYHHEIKTIKKEEDKIKCQKLLEASLQGDMEFIEYIRKPRDLSDIEQYVDGASGEVNIANKFKEQYSKLYTSVGDKSRTEEKLKDISNRVKASNIELLEVEKLTGARLKVAASRLKPGKGDVSNSFTS